MHIPPQTLPMVKPRFGLKIKAPPKKAYEQLSQIKEKTALPLGQVLTKYWELREKDELKGQSDDQIVKLVAEALKDAKPDPFFKKFDP